jgi:predicted lipoprotein
MVTPVVIVAILRPWTIRPIEGSKPAEFDASTFATAAWPRLLRDATQTAADVAELAIEPGTPLSKARFLRGRGVVAAIDRRSRVGVMLVQVSGSKPATVAIQIGPVIRGTALRDASSFIQFSDFTNQYDFAGAANALNDHVLRSVVGGMAVDALVGRSVAFMGAIGRSPVREDGAIEMVPVQVELVEAAGK